MPRHRARRFGSVRSACLGGTQRRGASLSHNGNFFLLIKALAYYLHPLAEQVSTNEKGIPMLCGVLGLAWNEMVAVHGAMSRRALIEPPSRSHQSRDVLARVLKVVRYVLLVAFGYMAVELLVTIVTASHGDSGRFAASLVLCLTGVAMFGTPLLACRCLERLLEIGGCGTDARTREAARQLRNLAATLALAAVVQVAFQLVLKSVGNLGVGAFELRGFLGAFPSMRQWYVVLGLSAETGTPVQVASDAGFPLDSVSIAGAAVLYACSAAMFFCRRSKG